jgi:cysteine-rich repeat protein
MKLKKATFIIGFLGAFLFFSIPLIHAYCGDRTIEPSQGEQCDDGNFSDGDGCTSYCKLEDVAPPEVTEISIPNGTTGVSTITQTIKVKFSEPLNSLSINPETISVQHQAKPLEIEYQLNDANDEVTIVFKEVLFSEASHAVRIKGPEDMKGNRMFEEFISVFETAVHIDRTAPHVVAHPPEGKYNYSQEVTLTPYLDKKNTYADFIDKKAIIYYTINGSDPTISSSIYETPLTIKKSTVLKFFGIDDKNNRSFITEQRYDFECRESLNSKRIGPFPLCRILECNPGFNLINNSCVSQLGNEKGNLEQEAVTAPLFPSSTPVNITSKPAIRITAQHRGIMPRPIIFKGSKTDSELHFSKDTKITYDDDRVFSGYLLKPVNRYIKEFPTNFGYEFKAILEFKESKERHLNFDKDYEIIIPLGDRFEKGNGLTVFTYNFEREQYFQYDQGSVRHDPINSRVHIFANETEIFFVAQRGNNFSKSVFDDMVSHWAKNYAEDLFRRGIVRGRSKGMYAPDEKMTRAEFTKVALEALGEKVSEADELDETPFPDVQFYDWHVGYIAKAKELGLVKGYPDGLFRPNDPILRAEATKIMVSAFAFDVNETIDFKSEEKYPDILNDQWYYPAMNFVVKYDLMDSKRSRTGKFLEAYGPGWPITRGEMAQLAVKLLKMKEAAEAEENRFEF